MNHELLKKPVDFEDIVQRVGFYFRISRRDVLSMTLEELFMYSKNAMYFHLEANFKQVKKPSVTENRQYEIDKKERISKQYEGV